MITKEGEVFINNLRNHLRKQWSPNYTIGYRFQGSQEYSYISISSDKLKPRKLKYVIFYEHDLNTISICLSGQNKTIRTECWNLLSKRKNLPYTISSTTPLGPVIIENLIIENLDLTDQINTIKKIENSAHEFITEINSIL